MNAAVLERLRAVVAETLAAARTPDEQRAARELVDVTVQLHLAAGQYRVVRAVDVATVASGWVATNGTASRGAP